MQEIEQIEHFKPSNDTEKIVRLSEMFAVKLNLLDLQWHQIAFRYAEAQVFQFIPRNDNTISNFLTTIASATTV